MGLLGDITAYIDNLKRRGSNTLADLATNPLGLLSRNLSAFSESLPAAPDSVMPSGSGLLNRPGFQQWGMDVALNAPTMGLLGHTVYHGSPHKFDKFDASKIGTGEGAQSYGHGIYFAENPGVAKGYKDRLGRAGWSDDGMAKNAAWWGQSVQDRGISPTRENIISAIKDDLRSPPKSLRPQDLQDRRDVLNYLENGGDIARQVYKDTATLYTVDLPDEWLPKMLDWDKPLSQQPEAVRKALEPYVAPIRKEMAKPADASWGDFAAPQKYDPTGSELLAMLRQQRDSMDAQSVLSNGLGPEVSQRLRDAGIPGIRYLDGGSRKSGEGTYNYVVFPGMEGLLKILSRE